MITQKELVQIYAIVAEMEAIKIQVEGMKVENDNCKSAKVSLTYSEEDFEQKAQLMWGIARNLQQSRIKS